MPRFFTVLRRRIFLVSIIISILFLLFLLFLTAGWRHYLAGLVPEKGAAIQFIIIVSLLIAIFISSLCKLLRRHLTPQTFEEKKDFILMVTQIIGGVTLLIGLFFTWQNINYTRKMSEETLNLSKEALKNSTQTLRAERYAKAVEQLGSKGLSVRVGAAYDLGNLASDPDPNTFYEPSIRALAAFIRESPKPKNHGKARQSEKLSADVQAALEVLGWRKRKWQNGESQRLDLSGAYLWGADLKHGTEPEGAHLEGAMLINANLKRAIFRDVNLKDAIFTYANLKKAILYGANLEGASLLEADLEEANLQEAKGLSVEQVKEAKNWEKARFSQDFKDLLRAGN